MATHGNGCDTGRLCENSTTARKAMVEATELRQRIAHGTSRWSTDRSTQASEGRQEVSSINVSARPLCRRAAALLRLRSNPRLTPWAILCRNSVATPSQADGRGFTRPVGPASAGGIAGARTPRRRWRFLAGLERKRPASRPLRLRRPRDCHGISTTRWRGLSCNQARQAGRIRHTQTRLLAARTSIHQPVADKRGALALDWLGGAVSLSGSRIGR